MTRTEEAMKSFVLCIAYVVCSIEDWRVVYIIYTSWPTVDILWPARTMVDRMKVCTDVLTYSVNR